ncbi:MAG: hypothetical protein KGI86_13375, partial [Betaproteobacteria bacterium]|nr:hypothetical protein [Betaproteobacteria bacterium]
MESRTAFVTISISAALFNRLQAIAEPLVDSTEDVLKRLIDCYEKAQNRVSEEAPMQFQARNSKEDMPPERRLFHSPEGALPIGLHLFHIFRDGKRMEAAVEEQGIIFNGECYKSPSPACEAAKRSAGKAAAKENGWQFWKYQDPVSKRTFAIDNLRPSAPSA